MSHHLGYEKSERSDSDNARNGHKSKRVKSGYGNKSISNEVWTVVDFLF